MSRFLAFLALTSLPVVLGTTSCTSTTTVSTSRIGHVICDVICILEGATTCSPGQLPTPPPAVDTLTSGCTVSVITQAPAPCGPCSTCIPTIGVIGTPAPLLEARATTTPPCPTPTTTVSATQTPTEICLCPFFPNPCPGGGTPSVKPAATVTETAGCTASVIVEKPDCSFICPTCAAVEARAITAPPCATPTTTVSVIEPVTEICLCPFFPNPCPGGGTPSVKPPTTVTETAGCTASVIAERPDCSFVCPTCA